MTTTLVQGWGARLTQALRLSADELSRFPNRLREPLPYRPTLKPAYGTLALLMLAALVPRLWMCGVVPTVCGDGTNYIAQAEAIEQSGVALHAIYRLNLYPLVLAGLHWLGLSWEAAGVGWGVACAVLTVGPLFGWIRRQLNDRVAVVACLLYAAHPEFIEWAPELLRDQTFWLLATTSVYLIWRAITEVRVRYFIAAGLVIPICIVARFEGVFLFVPFGLWSISRFRALRTARLRLVLGVLATLTTVPLLAGAVNLLWFRQASLLDLVHSAPTARVQALIQQVFAADVVTEAGVMGVTPTDVAAGPFSKLVLWKTIRIVERGLTPLYALLMLGGIVAARRRCLESDCLPLFISSLLTIGGVWVYQWYCGLASSRYMLSVVLYASPATALGLMRFCDFVVRRTSNFAWSYALAPTLVAGLTIVGWCDALSTQYESRAYGAQLGRDIRNRCGDDCLLVGAGDQLQIIGYYARARVVRLPPQCTPATLVAELDRTRPDAVVVLHPPLSLDVYRAAEAEGRRWGLAPIEPPPQTKHRADVLMLARPTLRR